MNHNIEENRKQLYTFYQKDIITTNNHFYVGIMIQRLVFSKKGMSMLQIFMWAALFSGAVIIKTCVFETKEGKLDQRKENRMEKLRFKPSEDGKEERVYQYTF